MNSLALLGDKLSVLAIPSRGSILTWLCERGRARARETGTLEPREEDIQALSAFAKAISAYAARQRFDPGSNPDDLIRQEILQRTERELKHIDEALRISAARLREASDEAARNRALIGQKPGLPNATMVAAVCVLAVSVAPTLHDFVFHTLPDDVLNWFLSIAVSALLGIMLAWGMFTGNPQRSRAPVVVGIVLSVGTTALRISAAETMREVLFALGLTLIEVGVVLFLDWRAGLYNAAILEWRRRSEEADRAEAASGVQGREHERLLAERGKLESEIRNHLSYVEERDESTRDSVIREQACVEAICDGYKHGAAENLGRVQRAE